MDGKIRRAAVLEAAQRASDELELVWQFADTIAVAYPKEKVGKQLRGTISVHARHGGQFTLGGTITLMTERHILAALYGAHLFRREIKRRERIRREAPEDED